MSKTNANLGQPEPTKGSENQSPKNKTEEITAILRDEILRGQYRAGERMPSERDLAARFEANRGAVREALKKLEQLGIASITPGGVRVVPVAEASLSILGPLVDLQQTPDPQLVANLLEVLGALVTMAARNAVQRATEDELSQMLTVVEDLVKNAADREFQHEGWRQLGMLFTEISENLVLRLIFNGLKSQLLDRLESRPQASLEFDPQTRINILERLATAMDRHDANGVANAIQEHFDMVNKTLQVALEAYLSNTQQERTS